MVRAVLPVLASDPVTAEMRVSLAFQALTVQEFVALVQEMAQTRELHADALTRLTQELMPSYLSRFREEERDAMERTFAASEDRYVRAGRVCRPEPNGADGTWLGYGTPR